MQSHRPKRALSKPSDDNILGISWKEERELRKAMYVSLRQQHQSSSDYGSRLKSLRSRLHSPIKSSVKNVPTKRRKSLTSAYLLKLRRTVRSNRNSNDSALSFGSHSSSESVSIKANCSKSYSAVIKPTRTRTKLLDSKRNKCSQELLCNTLKRTRATVSSCSQDMNAKAMGISQKKRSLTPDLLTSHRPTLMNASNDLKTSPKILPYSSAAIPKKNHMIRPGRPSKSTFNTCSKKCTESSSFSNSDQHLPLKCKNSASQTEDGPSSWSVSVHDFIDFLCYNGCTFDKKLNNTNSTSVNSLNTLGRNACNFLNSVASDHCLPLSRTHSLESYSGVVCSSSPCSSIKQTFKSPNCSPTKFAVPIAKKVASIDVTSNIHPSSVDQDRSSIREANSTKSSEDTSPTTKRSNGSATVISNKKSGLNGHL